MPDCSPIKVVQVIWTCPYCMGTDEAPTVHDAVTQAQMHWRAEHPDLQPLAILTMGAAW